MTEFDFGKYFTRSPKIMHSLQLPHPSFPQFHPPYRLSWLVFCKHPCVHHYSNGYVDTRQCSRNMLYSSSIELEIFEIIYNLYLDYYIVYLLWDTNNTIVSFLAFLLQSDVPFFLPPKFYWIQVLPIPLLALQSNLLRFVLHQPSWFGSLYWTFPNSK